MALSGRSFPSPAAEYLECVLNIQDYVVQHPTSTFLARAATDMGENVFAGDLLVIDRAKQSACGDLVLLVKDGIFKLSRLTKAMGKVEVWGVVIYTIHKQ